MAFSEVPCTTQLLFLTPEQQCHPTRLSRISRAASISVNHGVMDFADKTHRNLQRAVSVVVSFSRTKVMLILFTIKDYKNYWKE